MRFTLCCWDPWCDSAAAGWRLGLPPFIAGDAHVWVPVCRAHEPAELILAI